jgi:hypothetical protein
MEMQEVERGRHFQISRASFAGLKAIISLEIGRSKTGLNRALKGAEADEQGGLEMRLAPSQLISFPTDQ